MALADDIQEGVSDLSGILGTVLMYSGGAGLFIMAVVGTVAIDIVLLTAAFQSHNDFVTALVFMSIFMGPRPDPFLALVASPITTAIAVVLAVCLGVPQVGFALMAGWAIAASLCLLGYGLLMLSDALKPENKAQYGALEVSDSEPEDVFEGTYNTPSPI
jgi:hypothetical protein